MNNIPMKFDFTKSLNEQLTTFNYYENEYKMMALNIQNLRQELQRKDNNWNELKKFVESKIDNVKYNSFDEVLDKIKELEKSK